MSGVSRLKYSKKYHPMPIAPYGTDDQGDLSGFRPIGTGVNDDVVLRKYKDEPSAPKKYRPFNSSKQRSEKPGNPFADDSAYPVTATPRSAEVPMYAGMEREGVIRGRQKDKSSKGKQ